MNLARLGVPFGYPLAILVIVFGVVAAWDLWLRRHSATKWKEYAVLLVAGLLGGTFGVGNDMVTSWLSPEYFILGKGLDDGPAFRLHVIALGLQAGFGAGAAGGACFLFANNHQPDLPALPYQRLLWFVWRPALCAVALALVLLAGAVVAVQPSMVPEFSAAIGPTAATWFLRVWWIHLGLYLGLAVGIVWAVVGIRRARKAVVAAERS